MGAIGSASQNPLLCQRGDSEAHGYTLTPGFTHMSQFVHLHLHSGYSLLDGACDPDTLVKTAAKYGMPAVAVTDHGNLFGAIGFYDAANKAGVKPIIGCEMYVAKTNRFDRDPASGR